MINHLFQPSDATQILAMPLSIRNTKDSMLWHFSKSGLYTVKTAYHAALDIHQREKRTEASPSTPLSWKWLWKLAIPSKIKIFIWRLLHGMLATGSELLRRKLTNDGSCIRCGETMESQEHLFRNCSWAANFWYISRMRILITVEDRNSSLSDWIHKQKSILPTEGFQMFLLFLWYIWYARNSLFHDKVHFGSSGMSTTCSENSV